MPNFILIFLWIAFLIYWIVSARKNKKAEYRRKTILGGMIARIILILIVILLWVIPIFSQAVFSSNNIIQNVGIFFCVLGLAFAVYARRTLGTNWSANPIEIKSGHEFVVVGPYKWVRHPIYSGVILALLGTFLVDDKLRALILLILVAVGMFIRSRMEDKLMMRQFPNKYPEYKKKVKALVPKIF